MKKALSMLLAIITIISLTVLPASAEVGAHNDVEIIIHDETLPEETKAKIIEFYTNPEAQDGASTYGLTCNLLGHKYTYTEVTTVTHKASATAPRCLQKIYNHGVCTRCDSQTNTLKNSIYIYCCA
jgi:hypothetical protein